MRFAEIDGRRVGIWGYGREGRSALRALRQFAPSATVVVVADGPLDAADHDEVIALGALERSGGAASDAVGDCQTVILSPGVSTYRPDITALRAAGVNITSGTDMWFAENPDAKVIAVTGTKGKSTTSSLIHHLLEAAGVRTTLAGNIGVPLLDAVRSADPPSIWVFELSSQQAAGLSHSPTVGVIVNLYREHLDWHLTEDNYFADKINMLMHRTDGIAVLNHENDELRRRSARLPGTIAWFGDGERFHVVGDDVFDGAQLLCPSDAIPLRGRHNRMNLCAGMAAISQLGVDVRAATAGVATFTALPHRLQEVCSIGGVSYIDDSIATTPEATLAALDALGSHVVTVLLGGFDRTQDYAPMAADLVSRANVAAVITLPDNGERILAELQHAAAEHGGNTPILEHAADLDAAVARAAALTPKNGTVLLSPAAPSYGRFRNFEERGDAFLEAAQRLRPVAR